MTSLCLITPQELNKKLQENGAKINLVDIRETDEFVREHIKGALSIPLSTGLISTTLASSNHTDESIVFMCKTGMRTDANCDILVENLSAPAYMLDGGLNGWKKAGLSTERNDQAPLELNRQVQIIAGSLILSGVILSTLVHPGFIALSGFVGAGLLFAGISGWCGLARLLKIMPWNQSGKVQTTQMVKTTQPDPT